MTAVNNKLLISTMIVVTMLSLEPVIVYSLISKYENYEVLLQSPIVWDDNLSKIELEIKNLSTYLTISSIAKILAIMLWVSFIYKTAKEQLGIASFSNGLFARTIGWFVPVYSIFALWGITKEISLFGKTGYKSIEDEHQFHIKPYAPIIVIWYCAINHIILLEYTFETKNEWSLPDAHNLLSSIGIQSTIFLVMMGTLITIAAARISKRIASLNQEDAPRETSSAASEDDYERIYNEIESRNYRTGLWARCLAECNGDPEKTKAKYINYRAKEISQDAKKFETNNISQSTPTQKKPETFIELAFIIRSNKSPDEKIEALNANPNLLRQKDNEGNTLLHIATREGDAKLCEEMLKMGFSPHDKNEYGNTPYIIARKLGFNRIAETMGK